MAECDGWLVAVLIVPTVQCGGGGGDIGPHYEVIDGLTRAFNCTTCCTTTAGTDLWVAGSRLPILRRRYTWSSTRSPGCGTSLHTRR